MKNRKFNILAPLAICLMASLPNVQAQIVSTAPTTPTTQCTLDPNAIAQQMSTIFQSKVQSLGYQVSTINLGGITVVVPLSLNSPYFKNFVATIPFTDCNGKPYQLTAVPKILAPFACNNSSFLNQIQQALGMLLESQVTFSCSSASSSP